LTEAVLFGVGSPFVVDIKATCRRLGMAVRACIANREGAVCVTVSDRIVLPSELLLWPAEERATVSTFIVPLTPGYRLSIVAELNALGLMRRPSLLDPTAIAAESATVGEGAYVNAGAILAGAVEVGSYATVNRGASVGHHGRIRPYAAIGPGAVLAGSVMVGEGAFIGAGAVILPGCAIGSNAVVAAGAVVTRDVAANSVVTGNPAKTVRTGIAGYNNVGV